MEFRELQSGHRSFVSDSIVLTSFHCPANPGDKEQGIWCDSLLAMLGSSCLDYLKHPDLTLTSLVSIQVRTSCEIASPWSEKGAPHNVTCNICSNSDSTLSERSDSKKFLKIFCDTHFFWRHKICDINIILVNILWPRNYGKKTEIKLLILLKINLQEKTTFMTNNWWINYHDNIFFSSKIISWQKILHTGDTKFLNQWG